MSFGKSIRTYPSPGDGYLYAGTQDLACWLTINGVRVDYTIDFKTGTKPKSEPYFEWKLQTASYRNGAGTHGNAVVHLDKETGLPTFYDFSDTYDANLKAFIKLAEYFTIVNSEKIKDGQIPSSTTITGTLDKPALVYWAANCAVEYIHSELMPDKQYTYEELAPIIESARKNFRSVSKKAMDLGSLVHEAIETYLKINIEPPKSTPDAIIGGFIAFLEWAEKYEMEVITVEKTIYGKNNDIQ